MRNLNDLITRIRESLKDDVYLKETASDIISENIKVSISPDQLDLKGGVLSINAGPVLKNEIFLKQERILEQLKEKKLPITRITYR